MPNFPTLLNAWHDEAVAWCRGKNWLIRLPLLFFFVYIFLRHLTDSNYLSVLHALNLGIHELGHLLFACFGRFLNVFGGTFWECAAPFLGMWNFYRQKDFFAIALCFGWLSTALFSVARYAGDARAMEIPLVAPFGGGDENAHDWNYLLGQLGLLPYDQTIAFLIRTGAVVVMLLCLGASCWLIWQMAISSDEQRKEP